MPRRLTLTATALVTLALGAGSALAAASPTISGVGARALRPQTAQLVGTVNPDGARTIWYFEYGLSTSYGAHTALRSAGAGSKNVHVAAALAGLTPGTIYHFRLVAYNAAGETIGVDHSFRTAGHPPALAETEAASAVSSEAATLNGIIYPNDETTTYYFQYGTSSGYGMQTTPLTLPAGGSPVPVSARISGLASGTMFYFRLLAFHGSIESAGASQNFLTEPARRPYPRLSGGTRPRRARRSPVTLTIAGRVAGPGWIPAADACTGTVTVSAFSGHRLIRRLVVPLQADCVYRASTKLRRLPRHRRGRLVHLTLWARFAGNGYLAPRHGRVGRVTLGRR